MAHHRESVKLPVGFPGVQSIGQDVKAVRNTSLHSNIGRRLRLSSGASMTISGLLRSSQGKPKDSLITASAALTLVF